MSKGSKAQFKQFTINTIEDGCLVLKSLIVPTIFNLEKLEKYSNEAHKLLMDSSSYQSINADDYDASHDKILYVQRELLRFISDHQSSSFPDLSNCLATQYTIPKVFLLKE